MELQILHAIQNLHADWLNPIMIFVSALGNHGIFWMALGLVLVCIPKTRRCGGVMLGAMALSYLLGNILLKNLVGRGRPFTVDNTVQLLIPEPGEFSFPSGHTLNGFTAATVLYLHYHKTGIAALIFAGIIAFSRLYLFVHYPTDILAGLVLGVADAVIVYLAAKKWIPQKQKAAETK